jgi:predicted dienelactone hydrolase
MQTGSKTKTKTTTGCSLPRHRIVTMKTLAGFCRTLAILILISADSILCPPPSSAQDEMPGRALGGPSGPMRRRVRDLIDQVLKETILDTNSAQKFRIANLDVAVWKPPVLKGRLPLVIFSHGCKGFNTQTDFLMKALAEAGYLVMAPNHRDASTSLNRTFGKTEEKFAAVARWSDHTYIDRHDDLKNLIDALHKDPQWNERINWSQLALAGHSLGGYTVLACGGAWPSWKIPGIKAILALSPYTLPFLCHDDLGKMDVPVMYQGGTLDLGITPFVKGKDGAFARTGSPVYFVEFEQAGHFFWSNANIDRAKQSLIEYYSLAFLNKYVRNDNSANLKAKLAGVCLLEDK